MTTLSRVLCSISRTTLRPASHFFKAHTRAAPAFHTQIFTAPAQYRVTDFNRKFSLDTQTQLNPLRNKVFAALMENHKSLFDAPKASDLSPAFGCLKKPNPSHADCIKGLFIDIASEKPYKSDDPDWKKLQELVNKEEPSILADSFKQLYLESAHDGNLVSCYSALALFKLLSGHKLTLPDPKECCIKEFTEHLKPAILSLPLSHQNPRRLLEFCLSLNPANLRSLFWFHLPESLLSNFVQTVKGCDEGIF